MRRPDCLRQVLACLNISVFDPALERGLLRACHDELDMKKEAAVYKRDAGSLLGMAVSCVCCFFALLPYATTAGLALSFLSLIGIFFGKPEKLLLAFRCYFLCGLALLSYAAFFSRPIEFLIISLIVLIVQSFFSKNTDQKCFVAILFFMASTGVCLDRAPDLLSAVLAVFFLAGFEMLLFPVKKVYVKNVCVLFEILSMGALLFFQWTGRMTPSQNVAPFVAVYAICMLSLLAALWDDLDFKEAVCFFVGFVFLMAAPLFFNVGAVGCVLLLIAAFFIDSLPLAAVSVLLYVLFNTVWILSSEVCFSVAAVLFLLSAVPFPLSAFLFLHRAEAAE